MISSPASGGGGVSAAPQSTPSGLISQINYSIQPAYTNSTLISPGADSISFEKHAKLVIAGRLQSISDALDDYSTLGDVDNSGTTIAISLAAGGFLGPEAIPVVASVLDLSYFGASLFSEAFGSTAAVLKK